MGLKWQMENFSGAQTAEPSAWSFAEAISRHLRRRRGEQAHLARVFATQKDLTPDLKIEQAPDPVGGILDSPLMPVEQTFERGGIHILSQHAIAGTQQFV